MRHLLISGATGALGSALVPLFAAEDGTRVTLLLRASSAEHLEQRRRQLLDYWQLSDVDADARIQAVRGDTSERQMGLADADVKALTQSVTHIVHSAGNVKLNQTMDAARSTALGSAHAVVELARRCGDSGRFQKLEFVSTVGVAGRMSGIIPEQRFDGSRDLTDFHNTYEASKWEAERYLWSEIDNGLPATLHRPSMIVGDSRDGKIMHFQVFYHLTEFLVGRRTWGVVPENGDATLDIIPVDYVAKAIHLATDDPSTVGRVLHLCSGPSHAWPIDRLVTSIRQLLRQRREPLPRLKPISLRRFRRLLGYVRPFTPARTQRVLNGLPYLLDYLDEKQLFDNSQTNNLLAPQGLQIPAVETYLEPVMNAFWNRKPH